jgi:hypothetical protein
MAPHPSDPFLLQTVLGNLFSKLSAERPALHQQLIYQSIRVSQPPQYAMSYSMVSGTARLYAYAR